MSADAVTSRYPVADTEAAKALGLVLRSVGYSESSVQDLLGDEAYSGTEDDAPADERRLPEGRLATVIRLFFLQRPVDVAEAADALGRSGIAALEATGFATVGEDEVVSRVRILPIGRVLVAADGYATGDDPEDYVAVYTPTSHLLDSLTPRARVGRALDVATGSGVHALLAAAHADSVVATDVNARALAFTELNAALNGLSNIECRAGSLFEPVEGETFDLITCNAPYVVSPERRWAYRDAGFNADEVSERVVREAAAHLSDGGFASMLVSWLADDEDEPDERAIEWAEATGCDSWILSTWDADPLSHATTWNSHLEGEPFEQALDEWTAYFEQLGVEWISEGAILLHKRPGGGEVRIDSIEADDVETADEQIRRAFASRARMAELDGREGLLDVPLSLEMAFWLEQELEPHNGRAAIVESRIQLSEGTNTAVEVERGVLDVVAALDGRTPLRDVIATVARRLGLSDGELPRLEREALKATEELLELGVLGLR
jgi:methylase of polypeptide subunit release factors